MQIWDLAPFKSRPNFPPNLTLYDCFAVMSILVYLPPTGISSNFTSWLLWGIWTTRNLLLFENRAIPAKTTLEKAVTYAREWLLSQMTVMTRPKQTLMIAELPPLPSNVVMCDVVVVRLPSMRAGLVWFLTSPNLYTEGSRPLEFVSSSFKAKALAMRAVIQDAKRNFLLNVWFRTDNQELARAINSKILSVELFGVLMDIKLLSASFSFFLVSFFGRDNNVAADSFAKSVLRCFSPSLY